MKRSEFKTEGAKKFVENWIDTTLEQSGLTFEKHDVETSFGMTRVLSVNHSERHLKPLVYVPGARTCGAFLALSNQLSALCTNYRIYLLDAPGQVGLSDCFTPDLKDSSYGHWLVEVSQYLNIEKAVFVGTSFGGQIIMKFAAVSPELTEKIVLMNPIGFSGVSLSPINLYHTLMPVIFPSRKNVNKFLDAIVFTSQDGIKPDTKKRVADFSENAVRNFRFKGEYPSRMPDVEIENVTAETHLILGKFDGLIPYEKTIKRAQKLLPNLKTIHLCQKQAHGIEVSDEALVYLNNILTH